MPAPTNGFLATEQRLAVTCQRHRAFPREPAVLVRLVKHIYKRVHDDANAALKPWNINHPEYNLLMMLYGTDGYTLNPTQLVEAAGEKAANITRLTNGLCEKGLIERTASEQDRRRIALTLTDPGIAMIESFLPDIGSLLERQTGALSTREAAQLETLLKKFLHHLEQG